jgi:hypothetical protein
MRWDLATPANKIYVFTGPSSHRIQSSPAVEKEKPSCSVDDEQCWQQNRRDHFAFGR